jgi:ATP-binding cassette subfamily C (CFTR/MRP) protein 4
VVLVVVFAVFIISNAVLRNYFSFKGYVSALRIRKTLISALYSKVSRLSMKSIAQTDDGKIITILSADIQAIERPLSLISLVFTAPLLNAVALFLVWFITEDEKIVIITFLSWVAVLIIQIIVTKATEKVKDLQRKQDESRLQNVTDVVMGAKTVKCNGWQNYFISKIIEKRAKVVKYVNMQGILEAVITSLGMNMGLVVMLVVVGLKWLNNEPLEEEKLIPLMALVFYLFISVNTKAHNAIGTFQQLYVILERIGNVMGMEEKQRKKDPKSLNQTPTIQLQNASFSWGFKKATDDLYKLNPFANTHTNHGKTYKPKNDITLHMANTAEIQLRDITLDMHPGSLLGVMGKLGSGKTSLLMSIMQETHVAQGSRTVYGHVAYVEQEPFIFSDTIKRNILFGRQFDEELFLRAIKVTHLFSDFETFGSGLETVIGEKGQALTPSLKAKIALARAVYSDADIILLDDPLKNIESNQAKKIFASCIQEEFKEKIVVLVSNQINFLEKCPQIMVLEGKG